MFSPLRGSRLVRQRRRGLRPSSTSVAANAGRRRLRAPFPRALNASTERDLDVEPEGTLYAIRAALAHMPRPREGTTSSLWRPEAGRRAHCDEADHCAPSFPGQSASHCRHILPRDALTTPSACTNICPGRASATDFLPRRGPPANTPTPCPNDDCRRTVAEWSSVLRPRATTPPADSSRPRCAPDDGGFPGARPFRRALGKAEANNARAMPVNSCVTNSANKCSRPALRRISRGQT